MSVSHSVIILFTVNSVILCRTNTSKTDVEEPTLTVWDKQYAVVCNGNIYNA